MDMKHNFSSSSMVSKRRSNKPVVEKRRRERINKSLEELKRLVLQSLQKDTEEYEKMEKADILEMAVNHLKNLRKRQLHPDVGTLGQAGSLSKYRTGYNECATEVMRYLNHSPAMSNNPSVRARLVDHVSGCVQKVNNSPAISHVAAVSTYTPLAAAISHTHSAPSATPHASLPGSSGSLSSFTPVRKSPTEAFEAPYLDYSSNSDTSFSSTGSCVSPVDFRMNLMMSSFAVQSPSSSQSSNTAGRRSTPPAQSRNNAPAYLAAMDIEEIRAKYGNVWRPW